MAASCGPRRTGPAAPCFNSSCRATKGNSRVLLSRSIAPEGRANTLFQNLFIQWLAKVTDHAVSLTAVLVRVVGIGRDNERRNRVSQIEEVAVKVESGHARHADIGDQTIRFRKLRR